MSFRNKATGEYPVSHDQIRAANPNTSFPAYFEEAEGYDWVAHVEPPEVDVSSQYREEGEPIQVDGKWMKTWIVNSLSADEIASRARIKRANAEASVREKRNRLLAESDWTQVADAPVDKAAWAQYRQALRDITAQEGFPLEVSWPSQPA
jgi:hypothetical protein